MKTTQTTGAQDGIRAFAGHLVAHEHPVQRGRFAAWIDLARTVEAVHADDPSAPHGLAAALVRLLGQLEVHMLKEATVVFPALRGAARSGDGGGLGPLLDSARADHRACRDAAAQARAKLGPLPAGACRSWRRLHAGVIDLLGDLEALMHIEDEILLSRGMTGNGAEG